MIIYIWWWLHFHRWLTSLDSLVSSGLTLSLRLCPTQLTFQSSRHLVNFEAEMMDKQNDDCWCYLILYLGKVVVYRHVSFQAEQRFVDFTANDISGNTSPHIKCVRFTSPMRLHSIDISSFREDYIYIYIYIYIKLFIIFYSYISLMPLLYWFLTLFFFIYIFLLLLSSQNFNLSTLCPPLSVQSVLRRESLFLFHFFF